MPRAPMPGSSRQANEAYSDRTRGDEIAPFDQKKIPVQTPSESDDAFRLRSLAFWRRYPQQAPPWAKQELMDMAEAVFDEFITGLAAEEASRGLTDLAQDTIQYASNLVKRVIAGEEQPNPVFRSVVKAMLDHTSKLAVERIKGRNTLRVEAQRHRNEVELLKQAQGQMTMADRITIDHVGINRGGPEIIEATATVLDDVEEVQDAQITMKAEE